MEKSEVQGRAIEGLRRDLYKEHFKNASFEQKLDSLEQSLKQNNVRIVSMPESDEGNLTTQIVELLNLPDINEQDIESSYRLGKSKPGKTRDVIVKFVSKKMRDMFYSQRKSTPKNCDNRKAFINEDLTQLQAELFYDARRLVKNQRIHSTWTQEGNL